jgi:N,N'-diacetyllegionaminate synthase
MFLSSAFDLESLEVLHDLGLSMFKIPSGEITNLPYLRKVGSFKRQVLLSTGMANLGEIEAALQILEEAGACRERITVLHCNSAYPTPFEDVNLRAMGTIREAFQVRVGFSDHTPGIVAPIAAVALGAQVIEKHFTLDKGMKGPDHKASLAPEELQAMVRSIRQIEAALGSGIKGPSASEAANLPIVRKSIVALRDIHRGERFDETNITIKRPGTGISPMEWDRVLGRVAFKDFQADEMITLEL